MERDITERVVSALEQCQDGASAVDLAKIARLDPASVRAEMLDLEAHGFVVRTGRTRGTRWHLA